MIDLETTGLDPSFNGIFQIAAVRFNYETMAIGPSFVASLDIATNRFWDEDTRKWWMSKIDLYQMIMSTARPAEDVFPEFVRWCRETGPAINIDQRLWAKPIHFEWPFLQSYARQFQMQLPFHYRNAVDLNSFNRGLENKPGAPTLDKRVEFVGEAHNAIDDVLHQIKIALMARSLTNA